VSVTRCLRIRGNEPLPAEHLGCTKATFEAVRRLSVLPKDLTVWRITFHTAIKMAFS
jgi:hypothetical protein